MARELFQTDLIKLEVIGDEVNLQPDPFGLVDAATELVKLGFQVLPYCTEDWVLCRRLMDAGCEALMPWAAPIGTGQGPRNPRALRELRERVSQIPLIVDAGIGLPSNACQVMEWGFDGVLLNTAVSRSLDPVRMKSKWLWSGIALSLLIFLPNLIWQMQHYFISLDFLREIHSRDVRIGRTQDFLPAQLELTLFAFPLWLAGLYFYLFSRAGKCFPAVGWMYLVPLLLLSLLKAGAII